jgi:serine-type D-Ala-D-Ala carboxypeptidase (penicillin-binding protein 5/6)
MTIKPICAGLAALGLLLAGNGQASERADKAAVQPMARPDDPAIPIVLLVDLSSGALLAERNAQRRFVPASITKAMTLFVAFELIQQGKLDPETRFAISDESFRTWSQQGSTMYLGAGSQTRVDDLLMGIANISANDGAIVLAEGAAGSAAQWVALMNRTARELGMRDTRFGTPNGWPDEGGTFTTAADLVILARAMVTRHPGLYARYVGKPGFAYNGIAQNNHDPLAGRVPGADGIKTGFTNQAGHGFLGSAERSGRRLALVVAGSATEPARDALARGLIEWGFSASDSRALLAKGGQLGTASVQGGEALSVPLIAPMPVRATVPHGTDPELALSVRYLGPLRAPIRKGETVAELEISAAGMAPSYVPLVAGADVARADGLTRLRNGLVGLLRW